MFDDIEYIPTPADIKTYVDQYVIGQEKAKETLAVAVYEHLQACKAAQEDVCFTKKFPKNNVFLFGPTGCGKTFLLEHIAQIAGVPFTTANAPVYVPTGYRGSPVKEILAKLFLEAGNDLDAAEHGIIFLDEFDKRAARPGQGEPDKAFCREYQHDLLKMVEGAVFTFETDAGTNLNIDTHNILFVLGGACVGLEDDVKKRLLAEHPVPAKHLGFAAPETKKTAYTLPKDVLDQVTPADLIEYGFITEMVGRMPVICRFKALTKQELVNVLEHGAESPLRAYVNLFNKMNIDLNFTHGALEAVADLALERKIGARALHTVLENILHPMIFAYKGGRVRRPLVITENFVRGRTKTPAGAGAHRGQANDPAV
jgi:ATP-dependent Clp protease ATP-binding subunit ClpX